MSATKTRPLFDDEAPALEIVDDEIKASPLRAVDPELGAAKNTRLPLRSAERASNNPNTVSARAICLHVVGAAHRYAHYVRKARGVDFVERYDTDPTRLRSQRDVRELLTEASC